MVMNKLIESGLKPVSPIGDIFVLYCSHCLQQVSSACISGGRGPSLSTSLMSHSHDLRSRKRRLFEWSPFCMHVLDSNNYDVFRKRIIPFEAVNQKNNYSHSINGQFTAKKLHFHCSYHVLTSYVCYQSTDARQNEIYLLSKTLLST